MWPLRDPGHLNWVFTNITQASSVTTAKEKSKRGWFSLTVKCFDPKMAHVTTAYSLLTKTNDIPSHLQEGLGNVVEHMEYLLSGTVLQSPTRF